MPGKRKPPARPKHDASYKSFFAQVRTVADTLRAFASDLARHLDFASLERMPASFVTGALDQRHADMLWRVQTTGGRWLYIITLLEFQSTIDRRMALRMMEYTAAIWRRLEAPELGPGGEYPFVLPVVVYNGDRRWTAPTDVGDLLAPMPKELLGYRPCHRYLLVEIQAEDPAGLPPDNVLAMIARFEQAPSAQALEELVGSLPDWFTQIDEPGLAESFVDWIAYLVAEPYHKSGTKTQRQPTKERVAELTTLFDRVQQWGKERDQEWLQKGIEQGVERGIEQGIKKGIERGRAEGERDLARRLARDRFGARAARELSRALDELPEAAEVPDIVKLIFECETAGELLKRVREA